MESQGPAAKARRSGRGVWGGGGVRPLGFFGVCLFFF